MDKRVQTLLFHRPIRFDHFNGKKLSSQPMQQVPPSACKVDDITITQVSSPENRVPLCTPILDARPDVHTYASGVDGEYIDKVPFYVCKGRKREGFGEGGEGKARREVVMWCGWK